ncbi:AtpZ/AtpI family protein [Candidatus Gottesmanbacteria bacterium]|nr:AtpZ/AtpI family protein [Candidatus Gottesmanbacteria bacterium]
MEKNKKIEKTVNDWIVQFDSGLKSKKYKKARGDTNHILSLAGSVGFSMSVPLVGGAIIGSIVDRRLQTSPRMTLFFLFLGLFIGGYSIYKILKELENE